MLNESKKKKKKKLYHTGQSIPGSDINEEVLHVP